VRIALVVGIVLTTVNQLDVMARGDATAITWIKSGTNFVIPFIVSNLGLLKRAHVRASGGASLAFGDAVHEPAARCSGRSPDAAGGRGVADARRWAGRHGVDVVQLGSTVCSAR